MPDTNKSSSSTGCLRVQSDLTSEAELLHDSSKRPKLNSDDLGTSSVVPVFDNLHCGELQNSMGTRLPDGALVGPAPGSSKESIGPHDERSEMECEPTVVSEALDLIFGWKDENVRK